MRRRIASASRMTTTTVMITGTITIMRSEGRTTTITPMAIRIATPASNTITPLRTITDMRTTTLMAMVTRMTTMTIRIHAAAATMRMAMTTATTIRTTTVTTAWVRPESPCRV